MSLIRSTDRPPVAAGAAARSLPLPQRRVWDLPVRIVHWTLVAAVLASYVTNKLGVGYFRYHLWCGYTVIVLASFRLLWGLVGTRHARFWNFVRGPATTVRYAAGWLRGEPQRYAGHNPLGALMVIALLLALFVQAFAGLFSNDEILNVGPLYGYVSNEFSLRLTSLHRRLFDWIAIAIGVHVLAVIAHRWVKRENLVTAMWTGRKPAHAVSIEESIASSRLGLALLLIVAISGALAWVVAHAPIADVQF